VHVDEAGAHDKAANIDSLFRGLAGESLPRPLMRPSRMPMSPVREGAPVPSMMRAFSEHEIERRRLLAARPAKAGR
jgi:hypothetical protein